jgi:MFS family permease
VTPPVTAPARRARLSPFAASVLTFVAAASVLVLEIAAARLLAPYVGVTLTTYTAIIGVILAGIALGAWAGGRAADRYPPERLLGPTFVAGGVMAIASVPIVAFAGAADLGPGVGEVVVLAAVGFVAPATILSGVAPMIVKATLTDLSETGSLVGRLSAIGTAGAITGTFLTGFVLLGVLPTRNVILGVGALLVLLGVVLAFGLRGPLAAALTGLVAAIGLGGAALAAPSPCDTETRYYCVDLRPDTGNPDGRFLVLDGLTHSYVDVRDPTNLRFGYLRRILDASAEVIEGRGGSIDVLHVGGGGFSLPRYLAATYPDSEHVVLELDAGILDIGRTQLGFAPDERIDVLVGDARLSIADQPTDAYDIVVGDAFGGLAVPWHLTTREFLEEVDRVLRPDGVYVMNLIDYSPFGFTRAEARTAREVFGNVAVIGRPPIGEPAMGGNVIIAASRRPMDEARIQARIDTWGESPVTAVMADPADLTELIGRAPLLSDDYAPVDQLLNR